MKRIYSGVARGLEFLTNTTDLFAEPDGFPSDPIGGRLVWNSMDNPHNCNGWLDDDTLEYATLGSTLTDLAEPE